MSIFNMTPPEDKQTTYKKDKAAFDAASAAIIPTFDALPGATKTAALNTIQNWGAATDAQRITALIVLVALHQKAIDYLLERR